MNIYVARQPVFDREKSVFGYELIYRSGLDYVAPDMDGDWATAEAIVNSLVTVDLNSITRGKKALVKFTWQLLEEDTALLFSPASLVVQVFEPAPDRGILAACARLKEQGYLLALGDIKKQIGCEPLMTLADIIKIDYRELPSRDRQQLINGLRRFKAKLLADKVETLEEYSDALGKGYTYFQGFFFCEPVIVEGKELSSSKMHNLMLIQEIYKPEIDIDRLEALIKQDLALTYHLLRFINSAAFQIRVPVRSIRQAIVLLGQKELSKWVSLITLRGMGHDKPDELIVTALSRGRFCEALAGMAGLKERGTDLFLTGLFSLLDVFLSRPMESAISGLPLDPDIKATLLGHKSAFRDIFDLALSYEQRNWKKTGELAAKLSISNENLFTCYLNSMNLPEVVLLE